jgi:hypothetical protein
MSYTASSVFGDLGNTGQIMPLTDRPHSLSPFELAQINLNANIEKKAKRNANKAEKRQIGKNIMRLAQLKTVPLTPPPLPPKKRPLVPKSPVSNSSVSNSPVSNSLVPNYPVSLPPIPNRPLPKMTANQHPSVLFGKKQPTRPLPPLPVEGARRKTRRIRKNKTRKTRSNRRQRR